MGEFSFFFCLVILAGAIGAVWFFSSLPKARD